MSANFFNMVESNLQSLAKSRRAYIKAASIWGIKPARWALIYDIYMRSINHVEQYNARTFDVVAYYGGPSLFYRVEFAPIGLASITAYGSDGEIMPILANSWTAPAIESILAVVNFYRTTN